MAPKRLKILFITPWYPHREYPYNGLFVQEHAKAAGLRHDVTVLHCQLHVCDDKFRRYWELVREDDEKLTEGIPTYHLHYRGVARTGGGASTVLSWAMFRALPRLFRQAGRPDLIHAHVYTCGLPAVMLGKFCRGIPTVVSEHYSGFTGRLLSRVELLKARFAFGRADMVLPVSGALQRAIEQYGLRGAFRIVPNVVDTDLFTPAARPRNRDKPVRLLFVGWVIERKGLPFLLEAMAQLQSQQYELVLDIVGSGPEEENYARLAARLGLAEKVVFHGAKSKREVAEFFHRADIFVLPSRHETFGVVAIEAMACGVPVLATHCGGPEEFVTEQAGMVVPPQDVGALVSALHAMLDRLESYDRAAIAQLAKERFGYEAVAASLDEVYSQVTGSCATCSTACTPTVPCHGHERS